MSYEPLFHTLHGVFVHYKNKKCLLVSSLQNKVGKISIFWGIFNKTIVPFALVEYKMIIANLVLLVLLAIHNLRSNMCSEIVI